MKNNISFTLINYKLIIIIILNLLSFNNCQYGLQSPCPNVLTYQQDNFGDIYGLIKVDNYYPNNDNSLTVGTTSNNHFSNAKLELTQSQNDIFNAVQRRSPIYYRLITEDGSAPNVLDIVSNGATICTSKGYPLNSIFTVTHRLPLQSNVRNPLPQFIPTPVNNDFTESIRNNFYQKSQNEDVFTNICNGISVTQFSHPQNSGMRYSANPLPQFIPTPVNNDFTESIRNIFYQKSQNKDVFTIICNGISETQFSHPQNSGMRYSANQERQSTSNLNPFYDPLQWQQPTEQQQPTLGRVSTPSNQRQPFPEISPSIRRGSTPSIYIESPQSTKPNQNPLFSESPDVCGTTTLRVPLIFNGEIFQAGSWPWLTVLFRLSTKSFNCGGSLISHTSVVTAAHCFYNSTNEGDYVMGIGIYDIKKRQDEGAIFENIRNIRIHPEYNTELHEQASYADIAIVTLKGFIEYNRRIKPICLWNTATDFDRIVNKIGIVAGWVLTEPKGSPASDTQTYATAKIVSYADCIISNPAFGQIASDTTLCAVFRNATGPCRGEYGNGLMVEESGKWYLTGIFSRSLYDSKLTHGCKLDEYAVYTNALNLIEWIQQFMTE